jgi:acyl-CoA dehydrogenase
MQSFTSQEGRDLRQQFTATATDGGRQMNVRSTSIKQARPAAPSHTAADINIAMAAPPADLNARTAVVSAVAAANADTVDREARFPAEAIASARSERLLGIMVPPDLGGEGASISDVVDVCYALGRACSSTAMVYAMHQTKVACILRHRQQSGWHARLLRRLASEQLLLASSTTEGQAGGDVRKSAAAVQPHDARIALDREATVISYGQEADGIVTTARRSAEAAASDQVLLVLLKEDYALKRILAWDTLGMRGTCSAGFKLKAKATSEQILPDPYDRIHLQTMVPVAHMCWSGAWTGIAAGAVERARLFVREATRRASGQLPPGAAHLTRASTSLRTLRGLVASSVQKFEAAGTESEVFESVEFQTAMNLLKVGASELAIATVMSALQACGLSGYRNDTAFSIGRHLRDVLSSPIMINNDRILANVATASLLTPAPSGLWD